MLHAMIVDDEAPARSELRYLLEQTGRVETIVEAPSVKQAIECLMQSRADVVFLDISMPKVSGMQLAEALHRLKNPPAVVFVTAYSEHALKAFDVDAVDYLLKPVDIEELKRAVSRVAQRLAAGGPRIDFDAVRDAFRPREKFLIRLNDRIVPVSVRDIAYFYSEAKSTFIVTRDGKNYVLDDSLDAIESGLDPKAFFRISRGAIIAEYVIDSASKLLGGRLRLTLAPGIPAATDLTVSRARADAFLEWLEG